MTYQPKPGDKVTIRSWTTASLDPDAVRHLHSERDGTVEFADHPMMIRLAGAGDPVMLGTYERDGAEPFERYLAVEVHLQTSELVGRHVRIRRYQVPSSEVTGGAVRVLDCDVEGTVRALVSRLSSGGLIELDPASVTVHHVSGGHDQELPFGTSWRIGLGYVFLGQDREHGGSWTLDTEVEVDPEPRDLASAIDATPPGHLFADRELLNIARLGLSRIYTAPVSEASDGMRECARQALARLEGRDRL